MGEACAPPPIMGNPECNDNSDKSYDWSYVLLLN